MIIACVGSDSDVYVDAEDGEVWTCVAKYPSVSTPKDGKCFSTRHPHIMAQALTGLRGKGYKVPQHAIDELFEMAEEARE